MTTKPESPKDRDTKRPAFLPKTDDGSVEEYVGAGIGMVAGGVAGAIAGPVGVAVGATLGAVVGDALGVVMHEVEVAASKHDHALDDEIGVTSGPLGAAPVRRNEPTPG